MHPAITQCSFHIAIVHQNLAFGQGKPIGAVSCVVHHAYMHAPVRSPVVILPMMASECEDDLW